MKFNYNFLNNYVGNEMDNIHFVYKGPYYGPLYIFQIKIYH